MESMNTRSVKPSRNFEKHRSSLLIRRRFHTYRTVARTHTQQSAWRDQSLCCTNPSSEGVNTTLPRPYMIGRWSWWFPFQQQLSYR